MPSDDSPLGLLGRRVVVTDETAAFDGKATVGELYTVTSIGIQDGMNVLLCEPRAGGQCVWMFYVFMEPVDE